PGPDRPRAELAPPQRLTDPPGLHARPSHARRFQHRGALARPGALDVSLGHPSAPGARSSEVTMDAEFDRTVPVRAGEELPADDLEAYLRPHWPDASGPLLIEQFAQGFSNLTYLLRLGGTELVLRR